MRPGLHPAEPLLPGPARPAAAAARPPPPRLALATALPRRRCPSGQARPARSRPRRRPAWPARLAPAPAPPRPGPRPAAAAAALPGPPGCCRRAPAPATPASRRPHMQNRVGPNQPAHSRPCPQTACIIRLPAQRDRRSSPCSGTLVALALLPATQN